MFSHDPYIGQDTLLDFITLVAKDNYPLMKLKINHAEGFSNILPVALQLLKRFDLESLTSLTESLKVLRDQKLALVEKLIDGVSSVLFFLSKCSSFQVQM